MLSEKQCKLIETGLAEEVEPRKVAAYLCLNMGLTIAEAGALRRLDINLSARTLSINNVLARPEGADSRTPVELLPTDMARVLPMPPHVLRYLNMHIGFYGSDDCFIISGDTEMPALYLMQNILSAVCVKYSVADNLSATELRNAFIRRCIESGIDLYSLCWFIGIKQPNVLVKRFGEYLKPRPDSFSVLEKYGPDYTPPAPPLTAEPKRMNLLIMGAGSQGPVIKEIAEAIGVFNKIAFLDDDPDNKLAIGPLSDYKRYVNKYPVAIPSFGDSFLREKWVISLELAGYILPTLIHPSATVSPNADIGVAVVVEAKSIISAGSLIDKGVLVSSGSVIEVMAHVEQFSHVGAAVTVTKNAVVPGYTMVSSGTVVKADTKN